MLRTWDKLPNELRVEEVYPYYEALSKKKCSLLLKRCFDVLVSLIMLVLLLPVFLVLAVAIKLDSSGPVFFRQVRVTQYGREFRIFKFRTMVSNAEQLGAQVTTKNDARITRVGGVIRKYRLDEIPQLLNILVGDMSFVGTRPEVVKYVRQYTPEMMATLLLPAGVTSEASIQYRDEDRLLDGVEDTDRVYVEQVLPRKMEFNLDSLQSFSFWSDIGIMIKTLIAVVQ